MTSGMILPFRQMRGRANLLQAQIPPSVIVCGGNSRQNAGWRRVDDAISHRQWAATDTDGHRPPLPELGVSGIDGPLPLLTELDEPLDLGRFFIAGRGAVIGLCRAWRESALSRPG